MVQEFADTVEISRAAVSAATANLVLMQGSGRRVRGLPGARRGVQRPSGAPQIVPRRCALAVVEPGSRYGGSDGRRTQSSKVQVRVDSGLMLTVALLEVMAVRLL